MPKKILNINNFSGGLDTLAAPRDLKPSEFSILDGLDNEVFGKLQTIGKIDPVTVSGLPTSNSINNGNGLLHFNTDVKINDASVAATEYVAYHDVNNKAIKFIELGDSSNTNRDTIQGSATVSTGGNSFTGNVDMSVIDGDLRIYGEHTNNTNAANQSTPKIVQHIKYTRNLAESTDTTLQTTKDSFAVNDLFIAPVNINGSGIYDNTLIKKGSTGSPSAANNSEVFMLSDSSYPISNAPPYYNTSVTYANYSRNNLATTLQSHSLNTASSKVGGMICIAYFNGSATSVSQDAESSIVVYKSTAAKVYGLWATLVYDDKQESGPTYIGDIYQPTLTENKKRQLHLAFAGRPTDKDRVTGFKIYWGLIDSYNVDNNGKVTGDVGQRYLLAEVNYEQGVRLNGESGFSKFGVASIGASARNEYLFPPNGFSTNHLVGATLSDLSIEEPLLTEKHTAIGRINTGGKTSTVVNRKLYVGNVQYYDNNNTLQTKNDRLMKSNTNDFDFFDADNFIDVEVNDGEDITVLENLGGRILQFKQNTLFVINVSRDIEFLEGTYEQRGCLKPSHLVKAQGFVAWMNKFGIFMYDNRQMINLIQAKQTGQNKLNWDAIYNDSMQLSYVPFKEQLIVFNKGANTEGKGSVYLYDLKSGSFTKETNSGVSALAYNVYSTTNATNIVSNNDGELLFINLDSSNNYGLHKWSSAKTFKKYKANTILMKTKDFTFGTPSVPKNLNHIYVAAQEGDNIKVMVTPITDGANNGVAVNPNTTASANELPTSSDMSYKKIVVNAPELKTTASQKVYGYSISLVVVDDSDSGNTNDDVQKEFELHDIQLVYREMLPK